MRIVVQQLNILTYTYYFTRIILLFQIMKNRNKILMLFAISSLKIQLRLKNYFSPIMISIDLERGKIEFFKRTEELQVHFSWKLKNVEFDLYSLLAL